MQNGEVCQRKKLYKSGKILVTASIFAVMGFGTAISQANASSSDNDSKTQTISKIVKSKVAVSYTHLTLPTICSV